jgi:thioredoxin reductase
MEGRGIRRHRVAIVGGGFGGLFAAKQLGRVNWTVAFLGRGPSERVITAQQVFGRHAIEAQAAVTGSVAARARATAVGHDPHWEGI